MFGSGVWGTRLGSDVPPNAARTKHVPKRSIRRGLWDALGDATGDALILTTPPTPIYLCLARAVPHVRAHHIIKQPEPPFRRITKSDS
jgi:hypothetical protein